MGKIVSVVNQKGGVGKTTTVVNLAAYIGKAGFSVLAVDIDPQGNTSSGLGINKRDTEITSYDILLGETGAQDAIIKTEFEQSNF